MLGLASKQKQIQSVHLYSNIKKEVKFHFVPSEISLLNLDNSKNTPLLGVRLNIVIVISVKTESGNFEEHCYGWPC